MKKKCLVVSTMMLVFSLLTACSSNNTNVQTDSPASTNIEDINSSEPVETTTSSQQSEEAMSTNELSDSEEPAVLDIGAEDASIYNSEDNAVPLGQWVYYTNKNYASGEYEPLYIRITSVSRDQSDVQSMIESYDGNRDFTLTEEQARDIEYGIVEYEIYFAPDYTAPDYGITVPRISLDASPIGSKTFNTDDGMVYIGLGVSYGIDHNSSDAAHPGDTISLKSVFSTLKNYDESEYLFKMNWYEGEIETENRRELYFSAQ